MFFAPLWSQELTDKNVYQHKAVNLISDPTLYTYVGSKIHTLKLQKSNIVSKPILHINHSKSSYIPKNDLLNSSKLILTKGKYTFHGISYNFQTEGLHRILDIANRDSLQIIVYDNDVLKLLSSFSWMVKHGNKDESKSFSKLQKTMRQNNLSMTCGPVSNYVHKYLIKLGIKSRLIHFFRNKNFNSYDNGHILLEVQIEKQWVLVDIDNNVIFIGKERGFLSAYDIATQKDAFKKQLKLSSDVGGVLNFKSKDNLLNFSFYMENFTLNQWYEPIMKVLFIYDKGTLPLCTDDMDWEAISKYYKYTQCLDKKTFYKQNYGAKQ